MKEGHSIPGKSLPEVARTWLAPLGHWRPAAAFSALILAAMLLSAAGPMIVSFAAGQKALILASIEGGGLAGYALAIPHLVAGGAAFLATPLFLLGFVVAAERWLGAPRGSRRQRALVWTVQATYLVLVYAAGLLIAKYIAPHSPMPRFNSTADNALLRSMMAGFYFLAILFLTDLLHYWAHRAHHRFAFLWRFHAVHHAPRGLDALHNVTHPVEQLARGLVVALPIGLLPGADAYSLPAAFVAFYQLQNHLLHMNAPIHLGPFNRVIADNRYHFIHHSREPDHFNKNFAAIFPVIDLMFGTWQRPGRALPETGLDGQLVPSTLAGYMLARLPDAVAVEAAPQRNVQPAAT
ncbi:MAG TPA: sterol desaturase family protein [Allosphingosinicella sp.]|jgi:sterol desaturase/sphingolipid hydroxylase (fatty acid hydroxylase superfamily)